MNLPFDIEDEGIAGTMRGGLEKWWASQLGLMNVLIAGRALTLVPAKVKEFSRIKDLRWLDWGR